MRDAASTAYLDVRHSREYLLVRSKLRLSPHDSADPREADDSLPHMTVPEFSPRQEADDSRSRTGFSSSFRVVPLAGPVKFFCRTALDPSSVTTCRSCCPPGFFGSNQ